MTTVRQKTQTRIAHSTFLMVIAAECAFFGTMIMSFIYLRIEETSSVFQTLSTTDIVMASANTIVLLISAATARNAVIGTQAGRDQQHLLRWLAITMVLGVIFVIGQIVEFSHSGVQIDATALGGAFFVLLVFHAVHVLGGGFALFLAYLLARKNFVRVARHTTLQMTVWFWYFVVAVWLILYLVLYWV